MKRYIYKKKERAFTHLRYDFRGKLYSTWKTIHFFSFLSDYSVFILILFYVIYFWGGYEANPGLGIFSGS